MEFKLNIDMDNDEFSGDETHVLSSILWEIRRDVDSGLLGKKIFDENGNNIGKWEIA